MNINRHNYEEFFVLYWDNELTADEKKQVESFVQENADLQEEFRLFGETHFTPDSAISFNQKELLLNEPGSLLNFTNYEEQLLSYVDDELTPAEKNDIEKFAANHPAVQQELALLLKTKLQPEAEIVFPGKSVLYRKEEKVRVIGIYWRRLAVAAILLLMAGLITFRLINNSKNDGKPDIAVITPPKENKEVKTISGDDVVKQEQIQTAQIKSGPDKTKKVIEPRTNENVVAVVKSTENKNNLPKAKSNQEQALIADNTTTKLPDEPAYNEMKKITGDAESVASNEKKNLFDNSTVTNKTSPTLAIYNPDEGIAGKEKEDKGGLKGLLRKATRVFEHRTNIKTTTDDNKLLVGVFAVSLK